METQKHIIERMLGIKYPILLGGMGRVCDPVLASAVSEAGGLGTLVGENKTAQTLCQDINKLRGLTKLPFAVNIPIFYSRAGELIDVVIKEEVKVVITAAGNPQAFTKKLKEAGVTVLQVVSTLDMARKAEEAGVDAVIAEGFESGGMASKTEIGTLALIPQVVDLVGIPVVAAGGIVDARGYLAARALGACGVSLGTVFLASKECHKIGSSFREMLLKSSAQDTAILAKGVFGFRAIKNKAYHTVEQKVAEGANKDEIVKLVNIYMNLSAEECLMSCGQGVGLLKEIKSVGEIIEGIVQGSQRALRALNLEMIC